MSFASLISVVSSSLPFWEAVEYCATAIVVVAVIGEFLSEFKYFPKDERTRETFAKMSALVLIGGLAIELIGIVRTSQLTGRVIANLNRDASIALATAKRFESRIAEANQRAKSAEVEVASANEQSAKAELGAAQARLELAKVQERLADRTISDAQLAVLVDEVKPFAGQEFEVLTYWSLREPLALTNRISAALNLAGWKYLQHQGFEGLYAGVAGVLLEISPSTNEQTKKAAATIAGALAKIGIASQVRAEPLTDSRIHFRIGTKP